MTAARFLVVCIAFGLIACGTDGAEPQWKVGLAEAIVTPKMPVFMAGYAHRKKPFVTVDSDLWVKAMVLEDGAGHRAVIVTSDLIGFPASVAEPICQRIKSKSGFRREDILLNSSHTHSGPLLVVDSWTRGTMSEADAERTASYTAWLSDQVVDVVAKAAEQLFPANLSWGAGVISFSMNRREFTPKGVILGVNARGLADRSVPVLRVDGADGTLRAVLFGAAVHGTTLKPEDYAICGDYAGFAQEAIQQNHPGVQAMFMLGFAGDNNPYPHGTLPLARAHGLALAKEVDHVLLDTKLLPVAGPLTIAYDEVDLPLQPSPPRAELEQQAKERGVKALYAKHVLEMLDAGKTPAASYRAPFTLWQMGRDLTLVGLPGEVVVDYVPLLEKTLGPNRLWLAAYCNDVFGYIPSARMLAEGGYETRGLYSGGAGLFEPSVETTVAKAMGRLAAQAGRELPAAEAASSERGKAGAP